MGKCSYCRTETNSNICPKCGSTISNNSLFKPRKSIPSKSSDYSNPTFDKIEHNLDKLDGCLGRKLIGFIFTWIFMIILGIILTYLLQKNNIDFVQKYYNILQVVRLFLLSFGWIPAIIVLIKKR